jgi:tRNA threonylcarbamoyladenosine biosynthesis protein TsaE
MIARDEAALARLAEDFASHLNGGEVIELIGDVGAGKTTFVRSMAAALGVSQTVNSPSFTVMKEYTGQIHGKQIYLKHYDFYRLDEAGLMKSEIEDSLWRSDTIIALEWAKDTAGVLPDKRLRVELKYLSTGEGREVVVSGVKA